MTASSKVTTAPTVEPLTLAQAKKHLRIDADITGEDDYITGLIQTAREIGEALTWRAFLAQTITTKLDAWPSDSIIELSRPPLISVTSVKYLDSDGEEQTLDASSDYQVDAHSEPARLLPGYDVAWPLTRDVPGAIEIIYQAGYGSDADDVPRLIRQAMLLIIGSWYETREEPVAGATGTSLPWQAEQMFLSIKIR
jgi:uncharacterized phiE125 gp8 family phage protein